MNVLKESVNDIAEEVDYLNNIVRITTEASQDLLVGFVGSEILVKGDEKTANDE
jgi:hypothetical protein